MEDPKQQEDSEERAVKLAEVWERLDPATRSRVIELFAHSAFSLVMAQCGAVLKEDGDVSSREDAEGHGGAH